jgi:hypothetical protein
MRVGLGTAGGHRSAAGLAATCRACSIQTRQGVKLLQHTECVSGLTQVDAGHRWHWPSAGSPRQLSYVTSLVLLRTGATSSRTLFAF